MQMVHSRSQSRLLKDWFRSETLMAWLFILPSLIGITIFVFIPAARGFYLSFTNSDLLTRSDFIGLKNYHRLVSDEQFWKSLRITLKYVCWNIPIQTAIALTLSILLKQFTQSNIIRGIIFLPYLLPMVMVTMIWMTILDYSFGPLNGFLELLGFKKFGFFNQATIIPSLAWINTWRHAGYVALLFFAGLQTIPDELYEAAKIDGANVWQAFRGITWPLLRPVTAFVLITSVVGSFQVWDSVTVAAIPSGGPGGASRVIFWYITNLAFTRLDMGYAATVAVALFMVSLVIAVGQMVYFRANTSDLG